jgi:uncharacterized LabA/DUF88 family protein
MSETRLKLAVFIDFDNVEIGVKTTLGLNFDIGAVLEAVKERGEIVTKVAYGDWKRGDYGRAMSNHAVRLVQRVMTPGGDKNGADINLALDALEMAFTHNHINAFVIVGGDSDFITLVEKLKQYDRKVFVVGGRAFTSQVMQKNCTEFIAYENIAGTKSGGRTAAERGKPIGQTMKLDQVVPLVKRALKVLVDREVTPQLGLLKSTLLQLDSSFSERDYGISTFRDFAEKLAERGIVALKHSGRSTLVELVETGASAAESAVVESGDAAEPRAVEMSEGAPEPAPRTESAGRSGSTESVRPPAAPPADPETLAEGVALVRRALEDPPQPPRWPMYLRQMKQLLRSVDATFDERKYGSIVELMRACQKEGLVRLERDRQGGLRVFSETATAAVSIPPPVSAPTGQPYRPKTVPLGWVLSGDDNDDTGEGLEADGNTIPGYEARDSAPSEDTVASDDDADVASEAPEVTAAEAAEPAAAAEKPARAPRARKTAATETAEKPKRARKAPVARKTAAKTKKTA